MLRPHFESLGYGVTLAASLAAARAAVGREPPDAMLLDLHLPDGSGLDYLAALRADPATRALPVLVLTAEGEERVLAEAARLEAEVLTKPFSPSKLVRRVLALAGEPSAPEQP